MAAACGDGRGLATARSTANDVSAAGLGKRAGKDDRRRTTNGAGSRGADPEQRPGRAARAPWQAAHVRAGRYRH
jgi:hypothetical protein